MISLFNRRSIAYAGFILIAGYFLWTEHSAHIQLAVPYLPYLLLLVCPLLHVFMHGGHGHRHGNEAPADSDHSPGSKKGNETPRSFGEQAGERNND